MSIILCIKNYNFNAKYERKTSSGPITSACPITKPKVYYLKKHRNSLIFVDKSSKNNEKSNYDFFRNG